MSHSDHPDHSDHSDDLDNGDVNTRDIRIVTWNVLSPPLARPSWFAGVPPEALLEEPRREATLRILRKYIDKRCIICLQEVSRTWSSYLQTMFAQCGYTFVYEGYEGESSDFMGVAIAWPNVLYSLKEVRKQRVADRIPTSCGVAKYKPPSAAWKSAAHLVNAVPWVGKTWVGKSVANLLYPETDDAVAQTRHNVLLSVLLNSSRTGKNVSVSTYHLPCKFWMPFVMMQHARTARRLAERSDNDTIQVLCGDFNIKPTTPPEYVTLTGGEWESAHMLVHGREPEYTTWTPTFRDTLDYVLLKGSTIDGYRVRCRVDKIHDGVCPAPEFPSDHLPVLCDLRIS